MKLNEPGRQKLGRYGSPVCRHSIQSYTLTYYRLRKREPLIALMGSLPPVALIIMTFAVDWALNNNYLSIYPFYQGGL